MKHHVLTLSLIALSSISFAPIFGAQSSASTASTAPTAPTASTAAAASAVSEPAALSAEQQRIEDRSEIKSRECRMAISEAYGAAQKYKKLQDNRNKEELALSIAHAYHVAYHNYPDILPQHGCVHIIV